MGRSGYPLTKDLPKELAGKLPDAKQIEAGILREIDVDQEVAFGRISRSRAHVRERVNYELVGETDSWKKFIHTLN